MSPLSTALEGARAFFGSARLSSALALAAIGCGVFAFTLHNTIGWAGLISILAALIALCAASLLARWPTIEWTGLLPVSLTAFVGWACASVFWSQYQWVTLGSAAYLLGFTLLGIYVAMVRDTIQIVRAFGDVLRLALGLGLALEVFSGLLIDTPIHFLAITAELDRGGPISGTSASATALGILAIVGGISFAIEWRTRAILSGVAVPSLVGATIVLILSHSSVAWGTAIVAGVAMATLYGIRRLHGERRQFWQYAALVLAAIGAGIVWLLRGPIVTVLNGGGDLNYRLTLWQQIWAFIRVHPIEGWGWLGQWNVDVPPYVLFSLNPDSGTVSGGNAYLDVWLQLGIIGVALFLGMAGLAFTRSWLLGVRQRSVIYTWPAAVLTALLTAGLGHSGILIEFAWLTFVICTVKASQKLSWRRAFARPPEQEPLDTGA